jgi:DNA-binding transcriptional LysR family regulator
MQPSDRIGRRLSLRDLNLLLVVIEKRSMSKAAAQLAISQPVVSKAIANMERILGVPLLDRSPAGIEPTPYGRAIARRGVAAFDELKQGVKDIASLLDPTSGEVRIGCGNPLGAGIVATSIRKLSNRYPKISFHLVDGDLSTLLQELNDRNIDLAIGRMQEPIAPDDMQIETLFCDRLVVAAGPRNRWVRRKSIKLDELVNEPWIFPYGIAAASLVAEAFRAAGVDAPRATVSSRMARLNDNLLASGRFLTVFPESMIRLAVGYVPFKILPVALPSLPTPIVIVTLRNRAPSAVAQLFMSSLREAAKPLVKDH